MLSRAEWLKALGPRFVDRTDEAVEKWLAFIVTGAPAPSQKKPKEHGR